MARQHDHHRHSPALCAPVPKVARDRLECTGPRGTAAGGGKRLNPGAPDAL